MPSPEQIDRNIKPVPVDNLEEKIADVVPTYSRRQFLIKAGVWIGAGLLFMGNGLQSIIAEINEEGKEQREVDSEYPKIPREKVKTAEDAIRNFKEESERLAKEGKLEEISQVVNPESLKRSFDVLDSYSKRGKLEDEVWSIGDKGLLTIYTLSTLIGLYYVGRGNSTVGKGLKDQSKAKKRLADLILEVRADWRETPPTEEELIFFSKGLSYLPPVGGKIPLLFGENGPRFSSILLYPSLTAEQQANKVLDTRRRNELGEAYVHQLTVQGRLPDRFKYAALALILNSPYERDWNKPFFEAPWGKVAPLIHDGGNVDVGYNPVWQKVKGRTDFLERAAVVYEPELEELERLDREEKIRIPVDKLARAREEQEERNRLLIEARAYQRLGLALHCNVGTAPTVIPKEIRFRVGRLWDIFEESMDPLLSKYEIHGAAEVQWFREKPVEVYGWEGKRREADWQPIKEQLIAIEDVKEKNPEIHGETTRLLIDIADRIDKEIGLLPKAKNLQT